MAISDLIAQNDSLSEKAARKLLRKIPDIEKTIISVLQKYIGNFDTQAGSLKATRYSQELINKIEAEIFKTLKKSGYLKAVSEYLQVFPVLEKQSARMVEAVAKIPISKLPLTKFQKWAVSNTLDQLTNQGLGKAFIQPIKEILSRGLILGSSLTDVQRELQQRVGGALQRQVRQVAIDATQQYQGLIHQAVGKKFEMNAFRYIGGLVKDSRPQCVRWVNDFGGILTLEDLETEIAWAYANGAGMIPGTNPDNFSVYRGGYGCRHEAIPFFLEEQEAA